MTRHGGSLGGDIGTIVTTTGVTVVDTLDTLYVSRPGFIGRDSGRNGEVGISHRILLIDLPKEAVIGNKEIRMPTLWSEVEFEIAYTRST